MIESRLIEAWPACTPLRAPHPTASSDFPDASVRAIDNRWRYWPERVTLMQDWADLLDSRRTL